MANKASSPSKRSRTQRLVLGSAGLYLGVLGVLWALLETAVDRWWPATVLAYSPRWLLGIPFAVLLPAAWFLYRRLTWVLLTALVLFVGPMMGFCVPWRAWTPGSSGFTLRVLTCNIHRLHVTAGPLRE